MTRTLRSLFIPVITLALVACSQLSSPAIDSTGLDEGVSYFLTAKHSTMNLDVPGASSSSNGTGLVQKPMDGSNSQQFSLEDAGNGTYTIISKASGKALEINDGAKDEGSPVQQWEKADVPWQSWRLIDKGNGYYLVKNAHTGLVMDVSEVSRSSGAKVHQWSEHGGDNQLWKFTRADGSPEEPSPEQPEEPQPGQPEPEEPEPSPAPGDDVSRYGRFGMNNGTGYNTDPVYVDRAVARMKELGVKRVRMGMDGVNGRSEGSSFDFGGRDYVVNAYNAAGIKIHSVISFRGFIDGDDIETRKRNWANFVRTVMERYKGKISYYIIDNETDIAYGGGWNQAQSAEVVVQFNKIAYEIAKGIDPNIRIESSPATSPCTGYNRELLQAGIGKYADVFGTHIYGGQITEGENCLQRLKDYMNEFGVNKPVAISEAGSIASWSGGEAGRAQWFRDLGAYAKRFNVESVLAFDWDGHGEWGMEGTPSVDAWAEVIRTVKY